MKTTTYTVDIQVDELPNSSRSVSKCEFCDYREDNKPRVYLLFQVNYGEPHFPKEVVTYMGNDLIQIIKDMKNQDDFGEHCIEFFLRSHFGKRIKEKKIRKLL